MTLTIFNHSEISKTYGGVTVGARSIAKCPDDALNLVSGDASLRRDLMAGVTAISDGTGEYGGSSALDLLNSLNSTITTQFEKDDKDLKLASAIGTVDVASGICTLYVRVPGVPGTGEGRYVAGGTAWFETPKINDRVKVYITDKDNLLGYGADFILKSYTDDEMPDDEQGWRIPVSSGTITVSPIGGYGFLPAGFYLKVMGVRGTEGLVENVKFVFNVFWGKKG